MSYANFIPTVWAESFLRDKEKAHVFVDDCTREYEGELKNLGDEVIIPGFVPPTIHTMSIKDRNKSIGKPEFLDSTAVRIKADTIGWFNFGVNDIDAAQAKGDAFNQAREDSAYRLADEQDKYVAAMAASNDAPKLFDTPKKVIEGTATVDEINVLRLIDLCAQRLYENNVPDRTTIVATIPPRLRTLIKSEYLDKDTDNSKMMKTGMVGKYGNVILRVSNNVYSNGGVDKIMVRTQKAIAFVEQISKIKPYEPNDMLNVEAIKGMVLYGGKIVRPKEMIVADITY